MTYARNFHDQRGMSLVGDGPRGKKIEKRCKGCGTGIPKRKTYCGPCYDVSYQKNLDRRRRESRARAKETS